MPFAGFVHLKMRLETAGAAKSGNVIVWMAVSDSKALQMNRSNSAKRNNTAAKKPFRKKGASGKSTKPLDDHQQYAEIRKPADEALEAEEHEEARRLYLKGVKEVESRKLQKGQRISLLFAGAGVSAFCASKYLLSLKHFRQSFETMRENEEMFFETLKYVIDQLQTLPYYIKTEEQKKQLRKLRKDMFAKFRNNLSKLKKPEQKKTHHSYILHKEKISDDYAYLEDAHASETKEWLKKNREYAERFMQLALLNYELPSEYSRPDRQQNYMIPYRWGKYYYFRSTDPRTRHRSLARTDSITKKPKVFLSGEETCPEDYFLTGERFSLDGKYVAFGLSKNGSDWEEWRVKNIKTGKDISGVHIFVRHGGVMWHPSGKALVYWRQDKPRAKEDPFKRVDKSVRIYLRPLRKKGKRERLLFAPTDPAVDRVNLQYILDSKWVLIQQRRKGEDKSRNYLRKETGRDNKLIPLFGGRACNFTYIGSTDNDKFYIHTFDAAKNGKIIAVYLDMKKQKVTKVVDVIPESKDILVDGYVLKDRLVLNYLVEHSTKSKLICCDFEGKQTAEIAMPFPGIIDSVAPYWDDSNLFFSLSNFGNALTIYRHNLRSGKTKLFLAPSGSPCRDLKMEVVEVKSKDGSIVPMWLVYRRSIKPGPNVPTLMMVYGGFNVPNLPYCNYEIISWTEMGGIWAQPYLRGGGELGDDWHKQACKLQKQNTFDDAIACAQYLIKNKYTSAKKLAIKGGSNGGLTVGAVVNQAPQLFAAAISSNGLLDMLKFQKNTIGWAWESEYGSVHKKDEYKVIKSYSPYHNTRNHKYFPAMLLCANSGDDRVPPWHSYKYAAALMEKNSKGRPVILRVEDDSGHHNPRSSWEVRDQQAFLKLVLDF